MKINTKNGIFTLLALFLLTLGINAQTFDKTKMDNLFKRIENSEKGMGSISIFKNENHDE